MGMQSTWVTPCSLPLTPPTPTPRRWGVPIYLPVTVLMQHHVKVYLPNDILTGRVGMKSCGIRVYGFRETTHISKKSLAISYALFPARANATHITGCCRTGTYLSAHKFQTVHLSPVYRSR